MLTDGRTSIIKHQMHTLKSALVALVPDDVDLDKFYESQIRKQSRISLSDKAKLMRHCINWLYTKKCETLYSNKEFLEFLLWVLKETLNYVTDELQEEFTCFLIDVCLNLRRNHLYK